MWLSAFLPNQEVAGILSGIIVSMTNLMGGVQIPPQSLNQGWFFLYYTDGVSWALRLNTMTQFDPSIYGLQSQAFAAVDPNTGQVGFVTPYQFVSNRLQYMFESRWQAAGWLTLIFVVFWLFAIRGYRAVNHNQR